jgi:glycoside/pentoside/hexuronide:cation symporter, GPH family
MLPGLFVQERYFKAVAEKGGPKTPFFSGLKQTLSNPPFRVIICVAVCFSLGVMVVGSMGFYVATYHVFRGDIAAAGLLQAQAQTAGFITGLAAIPFFGWLSRRFGKVRALQVSLLASAAGYASTFWLYTPSHPSLVILSGVLISPAVSGLWVIVPSMNADIVDDDELRGGVRREGSFAAVFSWLLKAGQSVAVALSGHVLVWTGFEAVKAGAQDAGTLMNMRLCFAVFPSAAYLLALALLALYPITESSANLTRRTLEARRGAV